jgi:predicted ATPase
MKDLTLIIENVRTFRGRHEIPIRPLTILTGENSSGKTTLLAMFSARLRSRIISIAA